MKAVYTTPGPNNGSTSQPTDLASRVFENRVFVPIWLIFLVVVVTLVRWPIHDALLVCLIYVRDMYFNHGIVPLLGKHIRFSDGNLPPLFAQLGSGLGIFFLPTVGLVFRLQ